MSGTNQMDNTELNVAIFDSANRKYQSCKHGVQFMGQRSCALFHYILDTSTDVSAHCGCCLVNTKSPTTSNFSVR